MICPEKVREFENVRHVNMIRQKKDQLFYTTEADKSTDVKHAA
jgi:hypothetical protein